MITTLEIRPTDWPPDFSDYIAAFPEGARDEYGYQYFLPAEEFKVENGTELTVGYAGCDGIEFRLRAIPPGVWAYYPEEERYQFLGNDIIGVATGWMNGTVHV
ncbi:MAG: hypothetical protein AAGF54_10555 [Pseudomonadota bacterium]